MPVRSAKGLVWGVLLAGALAGLHGQNGWPPAGLVTSSAAAPAVPAVGAWGMRAALLEANSELSVAELNGKVYVLGGYPSARVSVPTVQVYDPKEDHWSRTTPLPVALNHTMSASVRGKLYLIGGQTSAAGDGPFVNTVYEYDPGTATWTSRRPMPTERSAGAAAVAAGKIYVAGGRPPHGKDFAVYDPDADVWRTLPEMPTQRNHLAAAAIDSKIYIAGGRFGAGFDSEKTDVLEMFDPATAVWTARARMPRPRGGVNGIAAYGCFHVFGGEGNTQSPSGVFPDHDVYDPAADRWIHLDPMPVPVHGVTGAAFVNGLIDLPGGGVSQGGSSGSTIHQVYRPRMTCR